MNCDRIAAVYRWLEYAVFHRELLRRRTTFYREITGARRVLALGDGDGRTLAAVVAMAPQASVDYLDLSAKMLALARARAGTDRVNYRQADARTAELGQSQYDVIITHFFLDCFNDLELKDLVQRTACAAMPGARWIVSEFHPVNILARFLIALMYGFFRAATGLRTLSLADHRPHLQHSGFRLERVETGWGGMLASELWVRQ